MDEYQEHLRRLSVHDDALLEAIAVAYEFAPERSMRAFGMVGLTLAAPLTSAAVHIANELRGHSDGAASADLVPSALGAK